MTQDRNGDGNKNSNPDLKHHAPLEADAISDVNQAHFCLSCEMPITGLYCAKCGQKNDDYRRSIYNLGKEVFTSLTALENRLRLRLRLREYKYRQYRYRKYELGNPCPEPGCFIRVNNPVYEKPKNCHPYFQHMAPANYVLYDAIYNGVRMDIH